jgi:hypothetical protein
MRYLRRILGVGLLALVAFSPYSRGGTVTYGNIDSGETNAFPFGGIYQTVHGANRYQQVYNGTQFGSGRFAVDSVTFFNGPSISALPDGTYVISISTTTAVVGSLDPNMANNVGPDNQTIFDGSLPTSVAANAPLTFSLGTAFDYNPANGNLLLDFQISGVTLGFPGLFVAQNGDFGNLSSRMVNGNASGTTGFGLVTQFGFTGGIVPEPGSFSMATIALVAVAAIIWLVRARSDHPPSSRRATNPLDHTATR